MEYDIEKTCCFTGSRPQNLPYGFDEGHPDCMRLKELLEMEIEDCITNEKISHFITGMAMGMDQWAAETVIMLKTKYPYITLEAAIPCLAQDAKWSNAQKERYNEIVSKCDVKITLQNEYTHDCMMNRNKYMVDKSCFVIAAWAGSMGGTALTLKYAKKLEKRITIINPINFKVTEIG